MKRMGCLFAGIGLTAAQLQSAEKPNIVVIMADDVGLGDIGHHVRTFMQKEPLYETPAIDSLARDGLWFTDGHSATALCSPTRYCVMSGNSNYRSRAPWGVWNTFAETPFRPGEATLGSVVRDAGYATGFVGKWHLGGDFMSADGKSVFRGKDDNAGPAQVDMTRMTGGGPIDCGFDYSFMLPCGVQGPVYVAYENQKWFPLDDDSALVLLNKENAINPKDISDKGPGPGDSNWDTREIGKLISAKAVDFIHAHAGKKPFFLYYCSPMAHVPHCPPDEFDGRKVAGSTPSRHLDCVVDLDCQVDRIIRALKENGVYENTLVVFMTDNGGLVNLDPDTTRAGHNSAGGWAGGKNSPLEGGHRVPFIAVWPGRIQAGAVSGELVVNTDLLATLAALVGADVPADQAMDSNNLMPLLTGSPGYKPRESLLLQAGSKNELIYRKGPWKLIIQSDHNLTKFEPAALFNLEKSPRELPKDNQLSNPESKPLMDQLLNEYLEIRRSGVRTVSE
jgi:arylsulfatase A-like enzyme